MAHKVRLLVVAGQWLVLAAMVVSLLTRSWYEHQFLAVALILAALALWSKDLASGERRWWLFYVAGLFGYTLLRAYADESLFPIREDYPIAVDRALFAGHDPVVWLQRQAFSPRDLDVVDTIAAGTHWSFFLVPHALAVAIYIRKPLLFPRYVSLLLGVNFAGLLLFFLVPTTPPWLAAQQGEIAYVYRIINLVGTSIDPETYRELYTALGEPNSVAAMPSIHMAVTFAIFLWSLRHAPALAPICLVYSLLMALSLVYLAEHYVLDLLVGVTIALLVDLLIEHARKRRARRPAPVASTWTTPPAA